MKQDKKNKNNCEPKKKKTGVNPPEAWAVAKNHDEDTKVHTPPEEAVEDAKDWVDDENQR